MCGIAGVIHSENKGPVNPEILRAMNQALTHRGPDDEGYYLQGPAGLAMRRLKIIDLEGGHQPIRNETKDVWTVFNGEIYNFQQLRQELIAQGHQFASRTDTEVIVHLYEEEGERFVEKLRGMFAIALWDNRRRELLLYRDRIGIKPLHYWFQNGTLVFGSEIKAILEYPEVSREISFKALGDYLSFLYIPAPQTIYKEIHKLPAGHWLRYRNAQIEIRPYWDFSYRPDSSRSEAEWTEKLRTTIAESVKLHMMSDVPLGAFLSGGVDSSTVVSWMSRQSDQAVKTYSIGVGDKSFNELPYARQVADYCRTDHHEKMVNPDAFGLLPKIIAGFDEPFADSSAIPAYLVSEFARQEVTVALSGDGGDELFGGYLWTRKELWLEKYRRLPVFLRKQIEKAILKQGPPPLREPGVGAALYRFLYDGSRNPYASFARRIMNFQLWMKRDLFQPDIRDEFDGENGLSLVKSYFDRHEAQSVFDKCLYFDSKVYLADDILAKVDRMSMMHSLEVRVPLLDHKVVELAAAIPFSLKMKGRTTKYILKKSLQGFLPADILKQRKQGFSIPLDRWFREGLSTIAGKLLLHPAESLSRRFFRPEYVQTLLAEHCSGRQRFGSQLYALMVFELWARMNLTASGRGQTISMKDLA